MFQKINNNM